MIPINPADFPALMQAMTQIASLHRKGRHHVADPLLLLAEALMTSAIYGRLGPDPDIEQVERAIADYLRLYEGVAALLKPLADEGFARSQENIPDIDNPTKPLRPTAHD